MKKEFIRIMVFSAVLGLTSTVYAAESLNPQDLKIDGNISLQYRNDSFKNATDQDGQPIDVKDANGFKTTAIINFDKPITSNLDIYARSTFQSYTKDADRLSDSAAYGTIGSKAKGGLDAIGLTYKNAGTFYKVGTQAFTLGATGIVYDNTYIGRHALPYTALIAGKSGVFDYAALYGQTNYQDGVKNDKFYGAQFFTNIDPRVKVGGLWVHENVNSIPGLSLSVNVYGVNAAYKVTEKLNFVSEYISANYNNDNFNHENTGYVGSFTYNADKVDSLGVSFWRVGQNASAYDHNIGRLTTFWANAKGYTLSWNHKLSTDFNLNVSDYIFTHIKEGSGYDNTSDRNSFRASVTLSF